MCKKELQNYFTIFQNYLTIFSELLYYFFRNASVFLRNNSVFEKIVIAGFKYRWIFEIILKKIKTFLTENRLNNFISSAFIWATILQTHISFEYILFKFTFITFKWCLKSAILWAVYIISAYVEATILDSKRL